MENTELPILEQYSYSIDPEKIYKTTEFEAIQYGFSLHEYGCRSFKSKGQSIKIYHPFAYCLIMNRALEVEYGRVNKVAKTKVIKGSVFFWDYMEGYKAGLVEFDRDYNLSISPIYAVNSISYAKHLKSIFQTYWQEREFVFNNLDNEQFFRLGKEAAFMFSIQELDKKYPLFAQLEDIEDETPATAQVVEVKKDYFIGDYALMYVYEDIDINESNCKELALKYGFNSKTSGKQLKDDYSKFRNSSVRTGLSENKKEDHAKLERMKRVLALIPDNERVKSEIQILENQIISFYKK